MNLLPMEIRVLAFGIVKDIFEGSEKTISLPREATVADLRAALKRSFPALETLRSWMIAVNSTYADDKLTIREGDEVAIIPPVSGG